MVGVKSVSHKSIAALTHQILELKHSLACKLLYLLHDYYCVCPRLFLVGDDGQYCRGEFTGGKRNECCARDINCADQIAGGTNVMKWRKTMEDFLGEADEIRAFCADTIDRMKKVFSRFAYTLVPHPEPAAILRQPRVVYEKLHVGLIGNISQNKGVGVIYALTQWLQKNFPDERLTIIGNWCDARPCPSNIVATGSYRQGELPDLVARTGVNVALFSSTFPETFSYVMHEIIQLGLPVACFDRGAQKDCALGYRHGRVIPSQRPEVIWQTLCKLFEDVKAGV